MTENRDDGWRPSETGCWLTGALQKVRFQKLHRTEIGTRDKRGVRAGQDLEVIFIVEAHDMNPKELR